MNIKAASERANSLSDTLKNQPNRGDAHFRVMRVIAANPHYSQRDIANALGISLGSVNYCLNALIDVGCVKAKNFRAADNKLRYAYVLTRKGLTEKAALTGAFLQRKMQEYEALKAEIEALETESFATQGGLAGQRRGARR